MGKVAQLSGEVIRADVATKIIPLNFRVLPKQPSMMEFAKIFPDNKSCIRYLEEVRWNNQPRCDWCGCPGYYDLNENRRQCKNCRHKFTVTIGTTFANNKQTLHKWFYLIYQIAINKKNISSRQSAKNIGVTQTALWFMHHKLRQLLSERETFKLSGIVEIDECFVAKSKIGYRWGAFSTRKAPILGMIERGGGRVKVFPIDSRKKNSITPIIIEHVELGSTVFTDAWYGYNGLKKYFNHDYVNHSAQEYVREKVHTNSIENVWSLFKKSIRGAHHSVSEKHIHLYCDEFVYKFNRRKFSPMDIFRDIIHRAVNKEPFISIAN